MFDLVESPTSAVVYARKAFGVIVNLDGGAGCPCRLSNTWLDKWNRVGQVPSLEAWRADPGAFGPTCAVARIETNGESYTVGGNCLAILGHAEDSEVEPIWLHSFVDRNKARERADVEV